MFARATTLRGSSENVDEGIRSYREALAALRSIPGNKGALLLIDRASGKGIGVTLWDDEDAMRESRKRADELREQAAENVQGTIESVEEYEVAVWEVTSS